MLKWVPIYPEKQLGFLPYWGVTCDGLASSLGGVEILLPRYATETRISSGSYEPVRSKIVGGRDRTLLA